MNFGLKNYIEVTNRISNYIKIFQFESFQILTLTSVPL